MCVYVRIGQKREGEGGGRGEWMETLFLDLSDQLISSVI